MQNITFKMKETTNCLIHSCQQSHMFPKLLWSIVGPDFASFKQLIEVVFFYLLFLFFKYLPGMFYCLEVKTLEN